ncbi:MAG: cobyric acid synthase [Deltaproteobacteria bacterium]|nr:cobyric acid synthase [Deltaproteobacteria bacterium]MBN2674509.1 cobyric acid synthase [Deltaproteobacteria bacterium]
MFVGTGSDVGKSVINAAFCRIFKQDGYSPAPFKAQNMSLNSYASKDGLELGRAQAVQAEACQVPCSVDMNPILLKPTDNMNAQVVLGGKPIGNKSAHEYFNGTDRDALFAQAMAAYGRLAEKYNPIVIEGAGSISELNLRDRDIVNMRVALEVQADVYLVADIDRGGVFGSVYGTLELLPQEERNLIKGVVINKFRGDIQLFEDGRRILEEITGIPVVAVIPYYRDIFIEDEDSVVIDSKQRNRNAEKINIAVVLLRHMSNFTDFNNLEHQEDIHLFYTANPTEVENADIVIIPGSKNTISDLTHLRATGLAKAILTAHKKNKAVYGICGGYQIMGISINDPAGVEGTPGAVPGLGLLPIHTTLTEKKVTEQCQFTFRNKTELCDGYEIHMGETLTERESPLCTIVREHSPDAVDGFILNETTWGTYIHGIFDNQCVVNHLLALHGKAEKQAFDYNEFKETQFNRLADHVRANCDMAYVYKTLQC